MKTQLPKKAISIALLLITSIGLLKQTANGQVQNALMYDGVNDNVTTTAASSLIANSTGISLSLWVYPVNAAPGWPDFDAFAGFRNDADADFYLVQVSATAVECRLRNSAGTAFDITNNDLVLNTWQHYVCTYDGADLKVYYNGVLAQTVAASGNITNSAVDFLIGDQIYAITHFYLNGKIDEVSLWNRALTASEINCIYNGNINNTDPSLKLYYQFNQGVAGGNNASVTTLLNSTGVYNGTLTGFALNGTTSNWVSSNVAGSQNVSAAICTGDSYQFGSQTLTMSGIYIDTLTSSTGCDSIVTLALTVSSVDTSVNLFSTVLHSNQNGGTYQWVDCNNGYAPISGATSQNFILTAGGSYAVIVSNNGCTDTSSCRNVTFAGINENNLNTSIHLYPNPVADYLTVNLDQKAQDADIQITDLEGRILWSAQNNNNRQLKIDMSNRAAGIYVLKVTNANGTANLKVQKNK